MTVTHYQSSKGPKVIADMPGRHARNAADKLRREADPARAGELAALDAHIDALPASTAEEEPEPAAIGHNREPATPETFEAIRVHIDDLYAEAKNWLDGEPIATQPQADEVSRLLGMIREAEKAADEARKAENIAFDKGKAEVQARYAPLISDTKAVRGKTVLAMEACRAALRPWLLKLEREREEAASRAHAEAARIAGEARAAAAASDPTDLGASERVGAMFDDARDAQKAAAQIERERPLAGGGVYRATGLRDNWVVRLADPGEALRHYWRTRRGDLEGFALRLAQTDVREGKRQIPGFEIVNEKVAV